MRFLKLALLLCLPFGGLLAQQKPLDHDAYERWRTIENTSLSGDGQWLTYVLKPDRGDPTVVIRNLRSEKEYRFERGDQPTIGYNSEFIIFKIQPALDTLWAREREKVKPKDLPKDTLAIFSLETENVWTTPELKDFKLPKKGSGWLAYRTYPDSVDQANGSDGKENYPLTIRDLKTGEDSTFQGVKHYVFSEDGTALVFTSESTDHPGVHLFEPDKTPAFTAVMSGKGKYENLSLSFTGKQFLFLADRDTIKKQLQEYSLHQFDLTGKQLKTLVDREGDLIPSGWRLSEHAPIQFSRDESKAFFGWSPIPLLEDTALVKDQIVNVDIWNYQDGILQTQQLVDAKKERERAYLVRVSFSDGNIVPLGRTSVPEMRLANEGNGQHHLGLSELPYQQEKTWVSPSTAKDLYVIEETTGSSTLIRKEVRGDIDLSPNGQYIFWYNRADSAWFTYHIASSKTVQLSSSDQPFYRETWDYPDYPVAYGLAGWTADDERLLLYDRYDLWAFDPTGETVPVNLTNGRATQTEYRYVKLDPDERFFAQKAQLLLHVYETRSKRQGYANLQLGSGRGPDELMMDQYRFSKVTKARETNDLVYTKEDFATFPDLHLSDLKFKKSAQVTDANPQQSEYLWGSEEMYYWTSADGIPMEGILFKPANFDPTRKYPMMVYFYRRNSDRFHYHWRPYPGRSIINFSFYTSRGYVVFMPDVVYKIGYPGESAFNSIMPGVTQLIRDGFVNPERIGVQGHSWGGYQIAYLITRTNLFRAAEAGAPVSNMFSAYGGIRWETGLSRMFQYERTQSRIGGTIWEKPLRYLENSPIFWLDKVNTPLLIMHNDHDGHVPWYQGIELFVGLRRLGRPAWMLNYNDQPHWPLKYQNRKDFQTRMAQYFDHYLKDEPAPEWMIKGVPATEKRVNNGLELIGDEYR